MLIRSQDKKGIYFLDKSSRIKILSLTDDEHVVALNNHYIGVYSNEEKAIKVLDMIQTKYFEHITVETQGAIVSILERPKTFQMPQDSEV